MPLLTRLREHAGRIGARDAIVSDAVTINYRDLLARVEAGAAALQSMGIGPGSIAGLTIADEAEHLIAMLSLFVTGASHMTLATHDTIVLHARLVQRLRMTHALGTPTSPATESLVHVQWDPATHPRMAPDLPTVADAAAYLATSGTTGDFKIVPVSAASLLLQAARNPDYAAERYLNVASIEHNNAKRHRLYCALQGGVNVFKPHGEIDLAAYCALKGVTCMDMSQMRAANLAAAGTALVGVKVRCAGSPTPATLRRAVEERVTRSFFVRYGATEIGTISYARPGEHDEAASVGRPVPGVELEIVDENRVPLAPGVPGEVRLRADGMATGYFDSPEQTALRFDGTWFYPGDIGTLRSDGSLVLLGRKDDMMILNGINIFPAEIERVLEGHPAVRAAAALPLRSSVHGQIPVAAVELSAAGLATTAELLAYARERLALRAPRRIVILDALPRTGQGKLLRREIATIFETSRGAA